MSAPVAAVPASRRIRPRVRHARSHRGTYATHWSDPAFSAGERLRTREAALAYARTRGTGDEPDLKTVLRATSRRNRVFAGDSRSTLRSTIGSRGVELAGVERNRVALCVAPVPYA